MDNVNVDTNNGTEPVWNGGIQHCGCETYGSSTL